MYFMFYFTLFFSAGSQSFLTSYIFGTYLCIFNVLAFVGRSRELIEESGAEKSGSNSGSVNGWIGGGGTSTEPKATSSHTPPLDITLRSPTETQEEKNRITFSC